MVLPDRELRFQISPNGIYYLDAADRENSVLLLNIVLENWEGFTQRDYKGAREAQQAMHLMGLPSEWEFYNMLCSNMFVNFPVIFDDVKNTKRFFLVLMSPR